MITFHTKACLLRRESIEIETAFLRHPCHFLIRTRPPVMLPSEYLLPYLSLTHPAFLPLPLRPYIISFLLSSVPLLLWTSQQPPDNCLSIEHYSMEWFIESITISRPLLPPTFHPSLPLFQAANMRRVLPLHLKTLVCFLPVKSVRSIRHGSLSGHGGVGSTRGARASHAPERR